MTTIEHLRSLQTRIRSSTGPSRELDHELCRVLDYVPYIGDNAIDQSLPRFTTYPEGLGACVALLHEVLPGAMWSIWDMEIGPGCRLVCPGKSGGYHDGSQHETRYDEWTPPTLCAAILDAIVEAFCVREEAKEPTP